MPATATCPWADCKAPVVIPDSKQEGDLIRCKKCKRLLRIKSLAPPLLGRTKG